MLNVLIVFDNEALGRRLKSILESDEERTYVFYDNSLDAVEYAKANPIDIAVISVDMPIMSGTEISEILYDSYPRCEFVFLFREESITDAVALFNYYDNCHILDSSVIIPDDVENVVSECITHYNHESEIKERNERYREKERAYKKTMLEMSGILNARVKCYSEVVRLFAEAGKLLFNESNDESLAGVLDFYTHEMNRYISLFLDRNADIESVFGELCDRCDDRDNNKYYMLSHEIEDVTDEVVLEMAFLCRLLSDAFYIFMNGYRGKIIITSEQEYYKMDVLYDVRIGRPDVKAWGYVQRILDNVIDRFTAKYDSASKDGILQYRMYFEKVGTPEGTLNE